MTSLCDLCIVRLLTLMMTSQQYVQECLLISIRGPASNSARGERGYRGRAGVHADDKINELRKLARGKVTAGRRLAPKSLGRSSTRLDL